MKALWLGILVSGGTWAAEPALHVDLGAGHSLDLVLVRSGEFNQGSPAEEAGRGDDETLHPVKLTQDFYLGRTAVTRGQWECFVKETGYRSEAESGTSGGFGWDGKALAQRKEFTWRNPGFPQTSDHPVCLVTFPDAEAFCRWFEKKSLHKTTLPTEAQWEYACRAGTTTPWHGGGADACDLVALHKGNAGDGTRPADSRQANPWGLFIGGNVGEWCLDWYAPYDVSATEDPRQANRNLSDKPRRVLRGGSWLRDAKNSRSAARYRVDPRSRNADIGFRIVCLTSEITPVAEAPLDTPIPLPKRVDPMPRESPTLPSGNPTPFPARTVHQVDHMFPGWICLLVPLGILVIAIRLIVRGRNSTSPFVSTSPPVLPRSIPTQTIRKVADGFWIHSGYPVGTPVHLRYWVGGTPVDQTLIYQPGPEGQFVYTGTMPDKVTVSAIRRQSAALARQAAVIPGSKDVLPGPQSSNDVSPGLLMTRALVFHADPRRPWLAARSVRSLNAAGITGVLIGDEVEGESPVLLLGAGLVLNDPATFRAPPVDGNLVGIGLPVRWDAENPWSRFHALHGGDYPGLDLLPPPACEWHSSGNTAAARLRGLPASVSPRVVHWAPIDHAPEDERLFVMEIVTSLQQGGAERIARDLACHLPEDGVRSRLVSLGKPHRSTLRSPPDTLDLSEWNRAERAASLADIAIASGVDVLHVHLTDAAETRALAAAGIPVVATIHNSRAGWPRDWQSLKTGDVDLLLACSQAVETELRESLPGIPVRTVWNGIQPDEFPDFPRQRTGNEFTFACVANPRPQKRLELLPAILAATRAELVSRGIDNAGLRLVIAGEVASNLPDAVASRKAVDAAAVEQRVDIVWTEGKIPVREVLEQADAMVSCSAHEGLSLAHLEGISSGLPVIACNTGGTRELAWRNPAVTLLPADATAEDFAKALADALLDPPPSGHPHIWRDFTTARMTRRVAMLARQVACRPQVPGATIWFVTNNLSTGGAQSSLRRLAKSLHRGGQRVRVAVLQEYPEHPTPGRSDLIEAGIDVFVPPPAGMIEPEQAADLILAEMAAGPPDTVVFWNAIQTHKLLLADALPFTRVYDISPGEMWFTAMERFLENPLPGIPCRTAADYGRLLAGIVVKYAAEAPRAAALGVPVRVIPNGVALPAVIASGKAGSPFVFGTAARISPQKRLEDLIEAFRLARPTLPGAVLRIAGGVESGAEEYATSLRVISRGLPIEWLGEIHDLAEFHQACDAFVMISEPAGCPNASLEALAAGLPVIATDVGGASEQVIDGVNGRLVPARDVAAFSRAMIELADDDGPRAVMGLAAREHVRRHFTLDRMTADYQALLRRDFGNDATTSS